MPARAGASDDQRGVALVLTVLIVAMLTVLVVGFNAATRTEQMAARNYSKQSASRAMVATAEQEAAALLATVLSNVDTRRVVTQPGRALVLATAGSYETNLLSSAASVAASAELVDLNSLRTISSNANTGYFAAPWVYVTNTVDGVNVAAGRYAFWIDDDGSRLNLNYAGTNIRGNNAFYPSNARPLDVRPVLAGISNPLAVAFLRGFTAALTNNSTNPQVNDPPALPPTPTWGYYFSPAQVRSFTTNPASASLWRALQFRIAGGAGNLTNNLPPAPVGRTNLNGPLLAQAPVISAGGASYARNFLANGAAGNNSLVNEIDALINNRLETPAVVDFFGGNGFLAKYGQNTLRQIVVNINDYPLATGSGSAAAGSTAVSGAGFTNSDGIPRNVTGFRPFIYLNEIAFRAAQATNPAGNILELQLWLQVELANPYSTPWGEAGRIDFRVTNTRIVVGYETNGTKGTLPPQNFTWNGEIELTGVGNNVPANSIVDTMTNSTPPNQPLRFVRVYEISRTGGGIPAGASNVFVESVLIEPGWVTLRQYFNNPATVRDWAQGGDFPANHFEFTGTNEIPVVTRYLGQGQTGADSAAASKLDATLQNFNDNALVRGIAKNDPRVRRYADVTPPAGGEPWLRVGGAGNPNLTLGLNNSTVNMSAGTGLASVPNDDPPTTGNNILSHPDFDIDLSTRLVNATYVSAFELGRVHTGLQWRTLHLHAQELAEGSSIPDWALLDVFTVTNAVAPAATRLNPNALPYPSMNTLLTATNATNQGLGRIGAYVGLINGFAAANNPTNAQMLVAGTLTNAGLLASAAWTPAQAETAGTNLFMMRFNGNWAGRRAALSGFPMNAYGSLAEIVEVDGVGNVGTSKSEKEARARVVYETMSPFSDTFTIYSIGQALEVSTYGTTIRTNVVGETRLRTQVTRDPATGEMRRVSTEPVLGTD